METFAYGSRCGSTPVLTPLLADRPEPLTDPTTYAVEALMEGDLDELIAALVSEHQAELLASLGDAD